MKLSLISVVIFFTALGQSYVLPRSYDGGIGLSYPSDATCRRFNASKPRSLTGSNAEAAATQYHATCRNDVPALEAVIKSGGLTILPLRVWPDEFSWSGESCPSDCSHCNGSPIGGYYLTPDLASAQYYAAVFLNHRCKTKGGGAVLELKLDSTDLRIRDGGQGKQGITYRSLLSSSQKGAQASGAHATGSATRPRRRPTTGAIAAAGRHNPSQKQWQANRDKTK
ncbi:hypothetical protein C8R47DRAFT_104640 [Mycena vitilis]|nr:hypothetical protein C8R47DRAFT_104640 [Mycena vitilis]